MLKRLFIAAALCLAPVAAFTQSPSHAEVPSQAVAVKKPTPLPLDKRPVSVQTLDIQRASLIVHQQILMELAKLNVTLATLGATGQQARAAR